MKKDKQLAVRLAALAAVAMLAATSAFAESRPSNETRLRAEEQREIRRERAREGRRGDDSRNRIERRERDGERRSTARQREARGRRDDRANGDSRSRRRDDRSYRGDRSSRDHRRAPRDHRSYRDHRQPFHAQGRITSVRRHGGGYRVWVHGARYPFFIPSAHYHRDRFRVGLMISLGGYYNRRGYYDYYDGRSYSRGELRGVVESVDYRRDTFVVRNEATGSFVTVVNRDRRREVRPGDYVEIYGDWTRSGFLRAYDVDLIDPGYYYRR